MDRVVGDNANNGAGIVHQGIRNKGHTLRRSPS